MSINFEQSFKKGLEAADKAFQINKEIDSVFTELSTQILALTEGVIDIGLQRKRDNNATLASIFKSGPTEPATFKTYIVAFNSGAGNKEEDLAEFSRSSSGYPCHLKYDDQEVFCSDKRALENQISNMLANVNIGKKLSRLMAWPQLPLAEDDED